MKSPVCTLCPVAVPLREPPSALLCIRFFPAPQAKVAAQAAFASAERARAAAAELQTETRQAEKEALEAKAREELTKSMREKAAAARKAAAADRGSTVQPGAELAPHADSFWTNVVKPVFLGTLPMNKVLKDGPKVRKPASQTTRPIFNIVL